MAIILRFPIASGAIPASGTEAGYTNAAEYRYKTRQIKRAFNTVLNQGSFKINKLEKVFDFFRGQIRTARLEIYNVLKATDSELAACDPATLFLRLRNKAISEDQRKFDCIIEFVQRGNADGLYSCKLVVGKKTLYAIKAPPDDKNVALFHAVKVCLDAHNNFLTFRDKLTLNDFTTSCIQTMSDDEAEHKRLSDIFDNPMFCRRNLRAIEVDGSNHDRLLVTFGDQTLRCSNRCATINEFREQRLINALLNRQYNSLRELIAPDHLTERDSMLIYTLMPAQSHLSSFLGGESLRDESIVISDDIKRLMHGEAIGNTTLGKCLAIPEPDAPTNRITTRQSNAVPDKLRQRVNPSSLIARLDCAGVFSRPRSAKKLDKLAALPLECNGIVALSAAKV